MDIQKTQDELSFKVPDIVSGGAPGDHDGTGDGPGIGPRSWLRLAKAAAAGAVTAGTK
jgi:hypothetical protein